MKNVFVCCANVAVEGLELPEEVRHFFLTVLDSQVIFFIVLIHGVLTLQNHGLFIYIIFIFLCMRRFLIRYVIATRDDGVQMRIRVGHPLYRSVVVIHELHGRLKLFG